MRTNVKRNIRQQEPVAIAIAAKKPSFDLPLVAWVVAGVMAAFSLLQGAVLIAAFSR